MTVLTTTVTSNSIVVDDNFPTVEKVSLELDSANPVSVNFTTGSVNAPTLSDFLNSLQTPMLFAKLFSLSGSGAGVSQLLGTDIWEFSQAGSLNWAFNSNVPYFESLLTGESLTLTYHLIAHDSLGNQIFQDIPVQIVGETKIINIEKQDEVTQNLSASSRVEGINASLTVTTEANTTLKIFDGAIDVTAGFSSETFNEKFGISTVIFTPISTDYFGKSLTITSISADGATTYDSLTGFILNAGADLTATNAPTIVEAGANKNLNDGYLNNTESVSTSIRVNLPITGSLAVSGDKVHLFLGDFSIKNVALTSTDIGAGYVELSVLKADLGSEGSKSLTAKIVDLSGNISSASTPILFVFDAAAPSAPTIAEQGTTKLANNLINATENTTSTIFRVTMSAAVSGETIELQLNNQAFQTVTVGGANYVDVTVPAFTTQGANTLTAYAIDIAGNRSVASQPLPFALDTIAPAAPTIVETGSTHLSDNKMNADEAVSTNFKVSLPRTGTLAAIGDIVTLQLDSVTKNATLGSANITASSVDFTLTQTDLGSDGSKIITAKITDVSGNVSESSSPISFVLVTVPPVTPTLTLSVDTGKAGDYITSVGRVSVGLVAADAKWQYSTDNGGHWLDGSGTEFTVKGDGNKFVLARQIDAAGNISAQSNLNFVLDTSAPITLVSQGTALNDNLLNLSEAAGVVFRVNLIGDVVQKDTVSLLLGGSSFTSSSISNLDIFNGYADFSVSKVGLGADGIKSITAQLFNAGTTATTKAIEFTLDTKAPNAPSVFEHNSSTDLIDGKMNNAESANTIFSVSLLNTEAVAGDSIELFLNDSSFSTKKTQTLSSANITNGSVNFTVLKADLGGDGSKLLTAKVTDIAGNASVASSQLEFTLDTVTPTSSIGTTAFDFWNSAVSSKAIQVNLGATAIAGDTVDLLLNGEAFKSVVLTGSNIDTRFVNIDVLKTDLGSDGVKSLTTVITDVAGNKSDSSVALAFTLDTNATLAPTLSEFNLTNVADGFINNTEAATTTFRATLPTLGSRAIVGDTIQLFGATPVTNNVVLTTNDIENGYVNFTVLKAGLGDDGSKSLTTKITDKAGNVSSASSAITLTLDTIAPITSTFATVPALVDGKLNNVEALGTEIRVNFTTTGAGAVVAGDKIELLLAAGSFGVPKTVKLAATDIFNGYANFIVKQVGLGADGSKSLTAKITDVAGNTSTSDDLAFTLKATLPTTPQLSFTDTGISTDSITNNPLVNVSKLDTGATWEYSVDKGLHWSAGSGSSFSVTGDGAKSVSVRQTDVAGNVSNVAGLNFTYDATPPIAPNLAETTNNLSGSDRFINNAEAVSTTFRANLDNSNIVGDKVELLLGGVSFATSKSVTITDANKTKGFIDFTVLKTDLGDDDNKSITAKTTDIAGNFLSSSAITFTLDTVATNAPTLTEATSTKLSDSKLNAVETTTNTSFRVALPTSGDVAIAGDKIELLLNGASLNTPKMATLNGANLAIGYVDFALSKADLGADGDKNLTAKITDQAGNISNASSTLSFTLKATLPPTPAVSEFGTSYLSDNVLNNTEATSTIFQVGFPKNMLSAGDKVDLLLGANSIKNAALNATDVSNGYVNFTVLKADYTGDGNKSLTAKITDTFNNISVASKAVEFVLNTSTTTTNFRAELPTSLAVSGNAVELLKNGTSFSPPKIVTLSTNSQSVDFTILNADLSTDSKLTSVITQTGTANRYYLDSSFSVALSGIKTTTTTLTAKNPAEVLQSKTVTSVIDDKGYLKTTIQEYSASNALLKTTVTEGVKTTVTQNASTTISIDITGLTGEIGATQTAYKIIERDGSITAYYLNNADNALDTFTNTTAVNASTTRVKFYNEVGAFLSRTDTTLTIEPATTLISHYNSANVLIDSTFIEGVKTTTKNASGAVTNIKIDTATLTGVADSHEVNLVNYVAGNTTYTLDLLKNLVKYAAISSVDTVGTGTNAVTTKTSQIYNNFGTKIGDGKLITQTNYSNYTETTTEKNIDGTSIITNTVINDGYKMSSAARYSTSGLLLSRTQTEGIKTTVFNADGKVTIITINTTGLNSSTVEGFKLYSVGDDAGNTNAYYLNATSNALEKYSTTQTNQTTNNTVKTTTFFDKVGIFTGKSVSVASTENGVMVASTKTYNVSGVLVSSSQTEGIKTMYYDGSGKVSGIAIDTTGLTATTTDEGIAYTDISTNATYYLDPVTNALTKYNVSNQTGSASTTITNTFFYDNKGALTGSSLSEVDGTLSAVTRYDKDGVFIEKTVIDGRKTTIYDDKENVQLVTVDVTGLTGTPDADTSTLTHYSFIKGENTIIYTLDANQALVKYSISQNSTEQDANLVSHELLNIALYNEKSWLTGNRNIDKYTVGGIEHVKSWTSTILQTATGKSISDVYDNDGVQTATTKNYDLSGNLLNSSRTEGVRTTFYKADDSFDKVQINVSGLKVITLGNKYSETDSNGVETIYTVMTGNKLVSYEVNQYSNNVIDDISHLITDTQIFNPEGQLTGSKVTDASTVNAHTNTTVKQYNATGALQTETKIEDRMTTVFNANNEITSIAFDTNGLTPTTDGSYIQESNSGTYRYYLSGANIIKYSLSTSESNVDGDVTHQTTLTKVFNNVGVLTSTVNDSVDSFTTEGILRTIRSESTKTSNPNGTVSETVRYFNDGNPISTTATNYGVVGDLVDKTQTVGHKITVFDSAGKITRVSIDVASTNGSFSETSNGITTTYYTESANVGGSYTLIKYSVAKATNTTTYDWNNREIERLSVEGTKSLKTTIVYSDNGRTETSLLNIDGYLTSSVFIYDANGLLTAHTETDGAKTYVYNETTGALTKITIDKTGLTAANEETVGNITTTYYFDGANDLVEFITSQSTTNNGRAISDTNTFNKLGVLTAKTHTEIEGSNQLSNSMAFNSDGTKNITDTTIANGQTFISTVIRKISDDSIVSSSQSDGIKTTFYNADGTVNNFKIDVSTKDNGTYSVTDSSGVETDYYVESHALTKYIVTQKPYIYTDSVGKQQTVTTTKTFDATNAETASSILNTVKLADGTEKAWSSFETRTDAGATTTTFLWVDDTKKGFSINQYDASNNNLGSVFAKSIYSGTDLKSVSIDVTKNLMNQLSASDSSGKVTYSVSHTLKTTALDTQTAYGSSLTLPSITTNDVVLYQIADTTATRYGVFGLDTPNPIHFVDVATSTTEHKIDNWYLSKLTATTNTDAGNGNKLIEIAAGNYTISGFKLGDVLHFSSPPTETTIRNSSLTDGEFDIVATFGTYVFTITLTGISNDVDASVGTTTTMTNFNTVFGFGTSPII